jgi:hypothetical protein
VSEIELRDAILRHALQLQRVSAGQQAEVEAILIDLEKQLRALLQSNVLSEQGKREIAALINQADEIIRPAYAKVASTTDTHALALIVADKTVEALEDVFPMAIGTPSAERLASLTKDVLIDGAPSSAWWEKQSEDTAFKFAAQVRQGVINGETNERIVARIVGRGGEPGIMSVARRSARALVHSSVKTQPTTRASRPSERTRGSSPGSAGSHARQHVCPRCAALDGQSWDLDGNKLPGTKVEFVAPGIHWGDRCVLSPIPKTFADIGLDIPEPEAGERASSEGMVSATTTFTSSSSASLTASSRRCSG